jgi:hypothetical protein
MRDALAALVTKAASLPSEAVKQLIEVARALYSEM